MIPDRTKEWRAYEETLAFTVGLDCAEDLDWSLTPEGTEEQEQEALVDFLKQAEKLEPGINTVRAAGDFLLSRDGHGAGLWDGPYAKADELHQLAKPYGESAAVHFLLAEEQDEQEE